MTWNIGKHYHFVFRKFGARKCVPENSVFRKTFRFSDILQSCLTWCHVTFEAWVWLWALWRQYVIFSVTKMRWWQRVKEPIRTCALKLSRKLTSVQTKTELVSHGTTPRWYQKKTIFVGMGQKNWSAAAAAGKAYAPALPPQGGAHKRKRFVPLFLLEEASVLVRFALFASNCCLGVLLLLWSPWPAGQGILCAPRK